MDRRMFFGVLVGLKPVPQFQPEPEPVVIDQRDLILAHDLVLQSHGRRLKALEELTDLRNTLNVRDLRKEREEI